MAWQVTIQAPVMRLSCSAVFNFNFHQFYCGFPCLWGIFKLYVPSTSTCTILHIVLSFVNSAVWRLSVLSIRMETLSQLRFLLKTRSHLHHSTVLSIWVTFSTRNSGSNDWSYKPVTPMPASSSSKICAEPASCAVTLTTRLLEIPSSLKYKSYVIPIAHYWKHEKYFFLGLQKRVAALKEMSSRGIEKLV